MAVHQSGEYRMAGGVDLLGIRMATHDIGGRSDGNNPGVLDGYGGIVKNGPRGVSGYYGRVFDYGCHGIPPVRGLHDIIRWSDTDSPVMKEFAHARGGKQA